MHSWKKWLVPVLFVFSGLMALFPAVVVPFIKGEPLNYTFLMFACSSLTLAVVFLAINRKPVGGSGPPSV